MSHLREEFEEFKQLADVYREFVILTRTNDSGIAMWNRAHVKLSSVLEKLVELTEGWTIGSELAKGERKLSFPLRDLEPVKPQHPQLKWEQSDHHFNGWVGSLNGLVMGVITVTEDGRFSCSFTPGCRDIQYWNDIESAKDAIQTHFNAWWESVHPC